MKTVIFMVIWFGTGNSQTFDTSIWPSLEACEAAKAAILKTTDKSFTGPSTEAINCIEVAYE